ncbi:metalloregulator ArsR/SmtB family transcription factor, partial [bacterium]|nr:metalloregulator ArsR/SmtB family transcription factor [bacterium]
METDKAAGCLEALSNATRLKIYRHLVRAGKTGAPVGEIQKQFNIPGSTLSHHLARLVRAELVMQERQSRTLICRANYGLMGDLIHFLTECCCVDESCK